MRSASILSSLAYDARFSSAAVTYPRFTAASCFSIHSLVLGSRFFLAHPTNDLAFVLSVPLNSVVSSAVCTGGLPLIDSSTAASSALLGSSYLFRYTLAERSAPNPRLFALVTFSTPRNCFILFSLSLSATVKGLIGVPFSKGLLNLVANFLLPRRLATVCLIASPNFPAPTEALRVLFLPLVVLALRLVPPNPLAVGLESLPVALCASRVPVVGVVLGMLVLLSSPAGVVSETVSFEIGALRLPRKSKVPCSIGAPSAKLIILFLVSVVKPFCPCLRA